MSSLEVVDGCPYGYRPYPDSGTNALNPCFISVISAWQAVFFLLIGSYQLWKLYKNKKVPPIFKNFPTLPSKINSRHLTHLTNVCFQSTLIICELALVSQSSDRVYPFILKKALYLNLLFNLGISLPTQYLAYFKSTFSMGNQLFYYMFQILLQLFLILQRYYHGSSNERLTVISGQTAMILEVLLLFNSVAIFIYDLCIFEPINELSEYYKKNGWYPPVHVLSYITFIWMNKLIVETYRNKKIKDPNQLPLPPVDLNIKSISKEFKANWELEKWLNRNSLWRAIWKSFGRTISVAMLYETTSDLLSVVQPQFLRIFIDGLNPETSSKYPPLNGVFIALTLFVISVVSVFLTNQFYIGIFEAGLGIRGSLASLVYQKSLRLTLAERNEKSTGDILNLMSVDVLRIQRFFENAQTIIGAPIQIIVVLTSLYWLLGKAVIGGLVTMAIMMPINAFLSRKVKKLSKTQMKYKDMRIKTITELLNAIKSIKLYAWEEPMMARLNHVRNDMELKNFRKIGIVSNLIYFAWNCVPLMVTCSTFGLFSLFSDSPLSPAIVFPSLSLFNILNSAIYSVPSMINTIIAVSYTHLDVYKRQVPDIGNELEIFQAGLNLKLELSSNPVILSLEDFLDCCRDIEFKEQLAWSPIPVHERKGCCELLYYNQDLDVYCRTLPYLPQNQVETVNDYSSFPAISKIAGKKMPITSSPDLFYLNDCDVVYWYDLTRLVCHYVNLTERDLLANEREKFLTSLDLLTAQITYVYMLFRNLRLVEDNFKKTLKKLIYTLSRFSINANIWFHSTPFEEREAIASQKDPERRSPLLQSILGTFQKFHFLLRLLHFLSNPNELTILPQLTPRFFKDSFNTISWNNPFLRKRLNQHMSHDLPRQMIKAVAGASGIVAENNDEIPASKQGTSCSSETSHHSPCLLYPSRCV